MRIAMPRKTSISSYRPVGTTVDYHCRSAIIIWQLLVDIRKDFFHIIWVSVISKPVNSSQQGGKQWDMKTVNMSSKRSVSAVS